MVLKTTRWSPDTCDCVIEYTWDNTVPQDQRVHTVSNVVRTCSAHSVLSTKEQKWNSLLDEKPRKNVVLQDLLDNGPTGLSDLVNGNRQLKSNIKFNFSDSGEAPNRVLTVSFTGLTLTTQQKSSLQTLINNKFGSGKVVIA